jgi:hypothetical protein
MRRIAVAASILLLTFSVALAEEFRATITKVEGNKVTLTKTKFNKDTKKIEKGDSVTLTAADNVKVVKGKFNRETKKVEAGEALQGGLKNELFSKGTASVRVVTDSDGKITEIIASDGGGFKKKKKDGR